MTERGRALVVTVGPAGATGRSVEASEVSPRLADLARLGGVGLGLALLDERTPSASDEAPLVVAVGDAVRRGVPTAVRATVLGRAALGGRVAQGQVGGSLGARLASFVDALVVEGAGAPAGSVLVVEEGGDVRLERVELPPDLPARTATLAARFGTDAVLAVGPAAEAGVRFASLAAGGARPSFVGRGGLALALARTGLAALVVRVAPVDVVPDAALTERLLRSPRLAARGAAGSQELWHLAAAAGELTDAAGRVLAPEAGAARVAEAGALALERHGCRGCPTPCGWTFAVPDGDARPGRFAATRALGPELGVERHADTLRLLAAADRVGVDSKELGVALGIAARSHARLGLPDAHGDVDELERWIEALAAPGSPLADGAVALGARVGDPPRALFEQVVLPHADPARLLGQCVGGGGVDPMRTFTVLSDAADRAAWERWLAPVEVPAAALDGTTGEAKGRLVAFQEELLAAVDLAGFCAFTAGALLADGLVTLDELARWLGFADGRTLRAAGATFVLARRALDERWGFDPAGERPAWAADALDAPGMLAEYRACRGLAADGRVGGAPPRLLDRDAGSGGATSPEAIPGPGPVRVVLGAVGALAAALERDLGPGRALELAPPARIAELLHVVGDLRHARAVLGAARPAVWRDGRRLGVEAILADGDRLELVLVVSGG